MSNILRRIAIAIGLLLLYYSIEWSQDGFRFDVAGDFGKTDSAAFIGYGLAISVTVVQFVFSTSYRELNDSLKVFGILAYAYSIYTNYHGILHLQGLDPNKVMAAILGFVMDGVPEPLIAWGLGESLSGDFIGNLMKSIAGVPQGGKTQEQSKTPQYRPGFSQDNSQVRPFFNQMGEKNEDLAKKKPIPFQNPQNQKKKNKFFKIR